MYLVKSPMRISLGTTRKGKSRDFILNLNAYRNAYFRILNAAKITYKAIIELQIKDIPKIKKAGMIYVVHKGDKRRFDIGNVASIHQKFFEDAMVEQKHLDDDNFSQLPITVYAAGAMDRDNPRVDIEVYDLEDDYDSKAFRKRIVELVKKFGEPKWSIY